MNYCGMPVSSVSYLCKVEFIRWRRKHRRARINKKWQKRYGAIHRCRGVAYEVAGMGLMCCPCVYAALQKEFK